MNPDRIELDVPHDVAMRIALEEAYEQRFRERIVEVLRKYNVRLEDAPLSALAMAMAKMQWRAPQRTDNSMTELEEFILAIDDRMRAGDRAEQALRAVVVDLAKRIRQSVDETLPTAEDVRGILRGPSEP